MKYQEQQSTDTQIQAAAQALLDEVGADFTIQQLAERVGMSRATLYRRIGSKEALLEQLGNAGGIQADTPDTRSRILQAARRVFGTRGLIGATMDEIAETAGLGVATLYRHFGDKDALVQAFASALPHATLTEFSLHPTADVRADLRMLLQALVPFLQEHRDVFRIFLIGNPAERAYLDRMRSGTARFRDHLQAYFGAQLAAGRLRAAGAPHELAQALMGMLAGFVIVGNPYFDQPPASVAGIIELVTGIFLDGLLPEQQGA